MTTESLTDEALFPIADAYSGDPINPGLDDPTPADVVATLTAPQRARRVNNLITQAEQIIDAALDAHLDGKRLAATCILFSGGNDSTILAHLTRHRATHAIHANTTIGIEETRQFVRDTCTTWGIPLLEETAPRTFRQLVLDQGFPGPGMHWKMYQRLKERALRQAKRKLITDSRKERVLFLAGRRRQESERRADIPLHEREGSTIWASPLAMWTKLDMNTYRLMHADLGDPVPVNRVSDLIHMSGECLCGAFAKPGELDEIGEWFPEVKAEIEALQREVAAAGYAEPLDQWGHGTGARSRSGRLCSSCAVDQNSLFDAQEATA